MSSRASGPGADGQGVDTRLSPLSFEETVGRLSAVISGRGLRTFCAVDHAAAAAEAGLSLRRTQVLIFGSPAAGTPLMGAHPSLALELPLRLLVWEGDDGVSRVSYLTAEVLANQFGVDRELSAPLGAPALIAEAVVGSSALPTNQERT
jgi:uncharacterized protein (DUF302 family)